MTALLEIRDLTVCRDNRQVLEINALSVEKGEVLAIIGPNGTGKSSLLLTLARLLQPEKGDLRWDGMPLSALNPLEYRRRIALVLQEPLLLDASVFENIAIGLRYRGLPSDEIRERVNKWLARVGIESLSKRPGARLSGGEAQRVSLARAFVLNPELLLLDEPFSALDAPTRLRLLDDLKSILNETNTTTVLITHDLKEAARLASRVAVMLQGKIVQIGSPQEVFANPASAEIAAFLGL
jgi:tungstate transport system ATP-binding protein